MSVRLPLRRQPVPASEKRSRQAERRCGSLAILAMMAGVFAIVCAVEILNG